MNVCPYSLVEEFNSYSNSPPGSSPSYQLVHLLVGEDQARHWMELAQGDHPEKDLGKETSDSWQSAGAPTGDLPRGCRSPGAW